MHGSPTSFSGIFIGPQQYLRILHIAEYAEPKYSLPHVRTAHDIPCPA